MGEILSLISLVSGGLGYSLLPARVAELSSRIELSGLESRSVSHQLITLLLPRNREREPNLLALSAECRMYDQRATNT